MAIRQHPHSLGVDTTEICLYCYLFAQIEDLENQMSEFNNDVATLRSDFESFKAKVKSLVDQLAAAVAAGQAPDLTELNKLVADENAEVGAENPAPTGGPSTVPVAGGGTAAAAPPNALPDPNTAPPATA